VGSPGSAAVPSGWSAGKVGSPGRVHPCPADSWLLPAVEKVIECACDSKGEVGGDARLLPVPEQGASGT
jgi:hypothetical protein